MRWRLREWIIGPIPTTRPPTLHPLVNPVSHFHPKKKKNKSQLHHTHLEVFHLLSISHHHLHLPSPALLEKPRCIDRLHSLHLAQHFVSWNNFVACRRELWRHGVRGGAVVVVVVVLPAQDFLPPGALSSPSPGTSFNSQHWGARHCVVRVFQFRARSGSVMASGRCESRGRSAAVPPGGSV